jgi:hypothetical protein
MKKYIQSNLLAFLILIFSLLLGISISYFILKQNFSLYGAVGDAENPSKSWTIYILGFLVTILGVLCGTIYREAMERRNNGERQISGDLKSFFRSIYKSTDFIMGVSASPIIFSLLIDAMNGISTTGFIIIALQNGFACSAIAGSLVTKNTPKLGGQS